MHEVLHHYAGERLGETAVNQFMRHLNERYNSYFVSFLQDREATINGLASRQAVIEIQQEIDNIRPVWHSIVAQPDLVAIARSAPTLVEYFSLNGLSREGDRLLQMAIQVVGDVLPRNKDKDLLTKAEKEKHRLLSYLLSQWVHFLIKLSATDEAVQATELAVEHAEVAEDIDAQLFARDNWGTILSRQGDFKAAQEQTKIAVQLSKQATVELFKIRTLVQQGINESRLGDFAQARQHYEQALDQYKTAGIEGAPRIAIYVNLGYLAISEGNYTDARKHYEQALSMYRQIGSEFGKSMMLAYISTLAFHEQSYSEALTLGEQALERFQEMGEVVREVGVLLTLGNVFARLGQWEKSKEHYQQALDLSRSIRNQTLKCEALIDLSLLAWQLGGFQEAFELSAQALHLTGELADRNLHAYALAGQGRALAGLGQIKEAAVFYKETLALRRELKQLHLAAEVEALIAYLYLNQGDLEQAGLYTERVMVYLRLPEQQDMKRRPSSKRTTKSNQNKLLSLRQLKGVEDPFQVYLICYQVLQAGGDERGVAILDFAANLLHEQAVLVNDANYKQSYLEDVPANRQILAARSKESAATVRGMAWVSGVGDR
jgi:tetratricopeptide (TPR) repeat protein